MIYLKEKSVRILAVEGNEIHSQEKKKKKTDYCKELHYRL